MDQLRQYAGNFWACVALHTTRWTERMKHEYHHFDNVEPFVTAEVEVNESLRCRIAAAEEEYNRAMEGRTAAVVAAEAETRKIRAEYAKMARPLLDEYDHVSSAKHYYTEILNLAANQEWAVSQFQSRETQNYGYQSKRLIALDLSLEALSRKVLGGQPFARELRALLDDSDSRDIATIASPLQSAAVTGLASVPQLRSSALSLARAMEDSVSTPSTFVARTWLDALKFRSAPSPNSTQVQKLQQSAMRDVAKLFLSHVDQENWVAALRTADTGLSMSTATVAARSSSGSSGRVSATYGSELQNFKNLCSPHVAAHQFLKYAEASLITARMAFVEDLLTTK